MTAVLRTTWLVGKRFLAGYHGWLLVGLWAAVQVGCWRYGHGPRLFGDGINYLDYAYRIIDNDSLGTGHYVRYAGYALFLLVFIKYHLGIVSICLAQVALSGWAAWAYYRTALRLSGAYWPTAFLATAALVSWVEVQRFNTIILTESLFTSLLLFCLWAIARVRNSGTLGTALGISLATAMVRPNGFIALAAAALAGVSWLFQTGRARWATLLLLGLLAIAWVELNKLVVNFHLIETYAAGNVIFGYSPPLLLPPTTLQLPSPTLLPAHQLVYFIGNNFWYFTRLSLLKLAYFLGWPKPWHSALHTLWSGFMLPLIYGLAVRGAWRKAVAKPIRVYLVATIVAQVGIVLLTVEDWDNRFSGPLLPYWFLLAALGAQPLLKRWKKHLVRTMYKPLFASSPNARN
jgi:hypothetical protein